MNKGWVKLHRELLDKSIWIESTPEQKVILVTLLLMANHAPKKWEWNGNQFTVESGQFITSLESIAKKSGKGTSIKNVRTALKRFENLGFLTNKSTNKNRLITIDNWEFYQRNDEETGKQSGKQMASDGQSMDKQAATNKNDKRMNKNVKNEEVDPYLELFI